MPVAWTWPDIDDRTVRAVQHEPVARTRKGRRDGLAHPPPQWLRSPNEAARVVPRCEAQFFQNGPYAVRCLGDRTLPIHQQDEPGGIAVDGRGSAGVLDLCTRAHGAGHRLRALCR